MPVFRAQPNIRMLLRRGDTTEGLRCTLCGWMGLYCEAHRADHKNHVLQAALRVVKDERLGELLFTSHFELLSPVIWTNEPAVASDTPTASSSPLREAPDVQQDSEGAATKRLCIESVPTSSTDVPQVKVESLCASSSDATPMVSAVKSECELEVRRVIAYRSPVLVVVEEEHLFSPPPPDIEVRRVVAQSVGPPFSRVFSTVCVDDDHEAADEDEDEVMMYSSNDDEYDEN